MDVLDETGKIFVDLETLTLREYLKLLAQRRKELKPIEARKRAIDEQIGESEKQRFAEMRVWDDVAYKYCHLFIESTQYAVLKKTQLGTLITEFEKIGYEITSQRVADLVLQKRLDLSLAQWAPISDPIYAPDRSTIKPANVIANIIIENSDERGATTKDVFKLFDNKGNLIRDLSYTLSIESYFNTAGLTKTEIATRQQHEATLWFKDDPEAYTIEGAIKKEELTQANITLLRAIIEEPFRNIFTGKTPVYFGLDV